MTGVQTCALDLEYQHSVCLGTMRQLASLWLDSKQHEEDWYLGTTTSIIDMQLLAIKPPVEVTRAPRSINDRKYWKASEWRSFLLFYALPVLNSILKKKYWHHLFFTSFCNAHSSPGCHQSESCGYGRTSTSQAYV